MQLRELSWAKWAQLRSRRGLYFTPNCDETKQCSYFYSIHPSVTLLLLQPIMTIVPYISNVHFIYASWFNGRKPIASIVDYVGNIYMRKPRKHVFVNRKSINYSHTRAMLRNIYEKVLYRTMYLHIHIHYYVHFLPFINNVKKNSVSVLKTIPNNVVRKLWCL